MNQLPKTLVYNNKTTNMNDIHRLMKYFNEVIIVLINHQIMNKIINQLHLINYVKL